MTGRHWLSALVFLVVFGVFCKARDFQFVHYDDQLYVGENVHLREGLTAANVGWALTSCGYANNWHPLAWTSLMADVSVDRLLRGGKVAPDAEWFVTANRLASIMHLHNVALHAANAVLLFLLLLLLMDQFEAPVPPSDKWLARTACLVLTLLWAVHPLRNETVCWVSERKELLCVFFMLLSLLAYCRRERTGLRLVAAGGCFVLALLAKPLAVTLPAVFFAWDWIVLRRIHWGRTALWAALSLGASYLTMISQTEGVETGRAITLASHVAAVVESPIVYLQQTVWPAGLSIVYHISNKIHPVEAVLGTVLLVAMVGTALRWLRTRSAGSAIGCFAVAWSYVGLLPMIGIVKVGNMEHADRYTYWVTCGLCAALALALRRLLVVRPAWRGGLWKGILLAFVPVVVLAFATVADMERWRNSVVLFQSALKVMEAQEKAAQ